jgi:hypothetical protein
MEETADQAGDRMMKPAKLTDARRLCDEMGASRLMVIAVDNAGNFAFTTWASTKEDCPVLARWADAKAVDIAVDMWEA